MKNLVVLTGAGISAESGLRTFRDSDGLWEGYPVEEVATPQAWKQNPALVLEFYNSRRRDVRNARPNAAHFGLAELQNNFNVTVITQNIDDLHERAGSKHVVHLHGEIFKMRSEYDETNLLPVEGDIRVGDLAADGHQLRPHIVWFGEQVPMITEAARITATADILVIVGTSLVVYPAAGLIHEAGTSIPKFILDRKIPAVPSHLNFSAIEKPATEGIHTLREWLMPWAENDR